jgi:hypothetical protein
MAKDFGKEVWGIQIRTKVIIEMIKNGVTVFSIGLLEISTKATTRQIVEMATVRCTGLTVVITKVTG